MTSSPPFSEGGDGFRAGLTFTSSYPMYGWMSCTCGTGYGGLELRIMAATDGLIDGVGLGGSRVSKGAFVMFWLELLGGRMNRGAEGPEFKYR